MKNDSFLKKRSNWFFAMTYANPVEFNPAITKADHYAYAYHDNDGNEPHYHVVLHFVNARTGYAVLNDFVSSQNTMIEITKNPVLAYDYLTHENDPDKFHYSRDVIVCDCADYWQKFLPRIRDQSQADFLSDLLADDFDLRTMACRYGRDFIKNFKTYLEFRQYVSYEVKFDDKN